MRQPTRNEPGGRPIDPVLHPVRSEKVTVIRKVLNREFDAGFSLVELLVVVIVLLALAAVAVPVYLSQARHTDDTVIRTNLRNAAGFVSTGIGTGVQVFAEGGPNNYEGRLINYIDGVGRYRSGGTMWIKITPDLRQFCITIQGATEVLYYDTRRGGIVDTQGTDCLAPGLY